MARPSRAVVLGGGGPVGRAWQTGFAARLKELGGDLDAADLIVGTSAGAIVGAEIALGKDLSTALPAPAPPAAAAPPSGPPPIVREVMAAIARAASSPSPEKELAKVGQMAVLADVPTEETAIGRPNLAGIRGSLWPAVFQATSVSVRTGRLKVWDASSGIPLEKAIAASTALPGVWPPITIGSDRYMDGGVRSTLNADLARGHDVVVVISCRSLGNDLATEIEGLRAGGSAVVVITPATAFNELTINGALLLNTALEPEAFVIGTRQAEDEITRIRTAWDRQPG